MKAVLQWRFGNGTKPIVRSSRSVDVTGDTYLPAPRRKATGIHHNEKRLGSGGQYKKKVTNPHKFELRRAAIKAHNEPTQEADSSKQLKKADCQLLQKATVPTQTVMHGSADLSSTSGLHSSASSCETPSTIKIDDTDDASDGLSMMARGVRTTPGLNYRSVAKTGPVAGASVARCG
jgi:hypothetical protein